MENQEPVQAPKELGTNTTLLDVIYSYKKMRESYEPHSYLSRRAYEGKHFVYWNNSLKNIQELPMKKTFFNQLPELAKQTDSFENFLLSTDFIFTITPKLLSEDESVRDSQYLSILAKEFYDKLKGSTIFSDFIHFALIDNVSFLEVYPDMINKTVGYRKFDFFDIIFNPLLSWEEQRLVVKVVRKKVSELRKSKLYTIPEGYQPVGGSNFLNWKDIYQQEKFSQLAAIQKDETLLLECHILDPEKGLRIVGLDGSGTVLRDDSYPAIKMMDILPLRIFSGEWYQPSYVDRKSVV